MRTPNQALLWEVWRTSRLQLLVRALTIGAAMVFFGNAGQDADGPEAQLFRGLVTMILFIASAFYPTWVVDLESRHVGFSFYLGFLRPVSTTRLVAVPLLYAVVAAVVCYWLHALLFGLLSGIALPLWSPSVLIACVTVCLLAALWSPSHRSMSVVSIAALLLGLAALVAAHHFGRSDPEPILLAMGKPDYFDLPAHEYAAVLCVTAIALGITLVSVDRQRHGDSWQLANWSRSVDGANQSDAFALQANRQATGQWKPFRSSIAAQFWFEVQRFGRTLFLVSVLTPLSLLLLITGISLFAPQWQGAPVLWLLGLITCPFVYQFIGVDGAIGLKSKQGSVEYSSFDATRPLRNDQLIAIKLLAIIACSLLGWLCMVLAAGLHATVADQWPVWAQIRDVFSEMFGNVSVLWWLSGALTAVLLYISSSSMLMTFGLALPLRPTWIIGSAFLVFGHLLLAMWDSSHGWSFSFLWTAYGYIIPPLIVVGCVYALKKALSAGFLGSRLFEFACCLWVVYVSSVVVLYVNTSPAVPIPTVALWMAGSLLLVPLAATAIAPLALSAHRNA